MTPPESTVSSRSSSPDVPLRTPSTHSSRSPSSITVLEAQVRARLNRERDDAAAARERSQREENHITTTTEDVLILGVEIPIPRVLAGLLLQSDSIVRVGPNQQQILIRTLHLPFELCLIAVLSTILTWVMVIFGASEVEGNPRSAGEDILIFLGLARRPIHIEYIWGFANLCIQLGLETMYYYFRIAEAMDRKNKARERCDNEAMHTEQAKLDELISADTAFRLVAHGLVGFATVQLNSVLREISKGIGALYLTTFLFILMLRLSNLFVDDIITQKNRAGGWENWSKPPSTENAG